jgi:hypothetical protein
VLFAPDGREIARRTGYASPEEMLAFLSTAGAKGSPAPATAPQ